jgi:hypothetical protein
MTLCFEELKHRIRHDRDIPEALVVVVLSQPIEEAVVGVDNVTLPVVDVVNAFNNNNCSLLRGNPKMFFLSAQKLGKLAIHLAQGNVYVQLTS